MRTRAVPTGSFSISGSVSRPVTLTVGELAQFPFHEATATYGSAKGQRMHTYRGAATPSGKGYWLLAADGGVFALGDATYSGRDSGMAKLKLVPSDAGAGYRIVHSDATVSSHGTLPALSKTSSAAKVVAATA
jgi:hypothetical protein